MHASNKDVGMPVVIIVGNRDAHVEAGSGQPGFLSNIREDTVAVVPEETVRILWIVFLQCGDVRAVGEEDVRPAVAVVVEDRDAARHGSRRMPRRSLAVLEDERRELQREVNGARRSALGSEESAS